MANPNNPSVAVKFSTTEFNKEIKAMRDELKTTRKEFQLQDETVKASGKNLDTYKSKYRDLEAQFKTQTAITDKYKTSVSELEKVQKQAAERQKEAKKAYDDAKKSTKSTKEEVEKLKNELQKADKGVETSNKNLKTYKDRLLESEIAAKKLENSLRDLKTDKVNNILKQLDSTGKSLTKKGAIMTAGVTTPLVLVGKQALETASDLQEAQNVVDVAFKDGANGIDEWSKSLLDSHGLSELTAKQFSGVYKSMANGMSITDSVGTEMAKTLTELTGDMASFHNVSVSVADTALRSVFTGETESLKKFGIVMTQANLQQYAYSQGIQKKIDKMSQSELVTLRYNYVLSQTAQAEGDFARTIDSTANQTRLAQERFKALSVELVNELMPIANDLLHTSNKWLKDFESLDEQTKKNIVTTLALAAAIGPVTTAIGGTISVTSKLFALVQAHPIGMLITAVGLLVTGITSAVIAEEKALRSTGELTAKVNELSTAHKNACSEIQNTNDSTVAEMENAQKLIPELETLAENTNRSSEENARLNQIISTLNDVFPDLKLAIDDQTGALNTQISTIYAAAEAWITLTKAQGAKDLIAEKTKYIAELTLQQKKNTDAVNNAWKEMGIADRKYSDAYSDMMSDPNRTFADLRNVNNLLIKSSAARKNHSDAVNASNATNEKINETNEEIKFLTGLAFSDEITNAETILKNLGYSSKDTYPGGVTSTGTTSTNSQTAEKAHKEYVDSFKNTIPEQEKALDDYWNRQEQLGNVDLETKSLIYSELERRNLEYCNQVLADEKLTAEEKEELYTQYLDSATTAHVNFLANEKERNKQSLADQLELSKKYVSQIAYSGNMNGDSWESIKSRVAQRYNTAVANGTLTQGEADEFIKQFNDHIYSEQMSNADRWIEDELFYGRMNPDQHYQALARKLKYATEQGDVEAIREIEKEMYTVKKEYAEKLHKEKMELSEREYNNERKAIEDKYDAILRAENRLDRQEDKSAIQSQMDLYRNAVTVEGQEKFKQLTEELKQFEREEKHELLEIQKADELEALDKEWQNYQESQAEALKLMTESFALAGTNIADIAAATAQVLKDINSSLSSASVTYWKEDPSKSVTNNTFTQINNNAIYSKSIAKDYANTSVSAWLKGVK